MIRWVARVVVVAPVAGAAAYHFPPLPLLAVGALFVLAALPFVAPDPPAQGRGKGP